MEKLYGLTAKDRADWEKKYYDKIQGYDESQKERLFRNTKFREKFGEDPNFNEFMKLSPEERDSMYNKSVFANLATPTFSTEPESKYELNEESLLEGIQKAEQFEANREQFAKLNKWQGTAARSIEEFDKIATEVSPYYAKYKGSSYLPNTKMDTKEGKESMLELANTYNATLNTYGKEYADNWLKREMQSTASENQSVGEKLFNTALGFGYDAGSMLLTFAGMTKGVIDYALDNNDKGFIDNLVDNSWVDYANDVFQYKTYMPERIEEAKKYNIAENPIIKNIADEENILTFNNVLDIAANQGFTLSSILLSSGLTSIGNLLSKGAKGAAKMAIKSDKALTTTLEWLQRLQKVGNGLVIPSLVGTTEGVMEANMAGREYLENAEQMINEAETKSVQDKLTEVLGDSEQFTEYLNRIGLNVEPVREAIASGNVSNEMYEAIVGGIYGEIVKDYSDRRESSLKKAEENASKVRGVVLGGNSVINGIMHTTLKAGLHSKEVQEALHRGKESLKNIPLFKNFISNTSKFDIVGDKAIAKNPIVKRALKVIGEPTGEFIEESSQTLIQDVASAGGEYNLGNFIEQKYNDEGQEILNESIWEDTKAALSAGINSISSRETLVSGIHGALGSMLGVPLLRGRRGPKERQENEKGFFGTLSYMNRRSIGLSYRNPIYESIKDQIEERKQDVETAEELTKWLQNPNVRARYDGAAGTFNWLAEMERARDNNDEFKFETSRMAKMANDLMMLEKLKGTSYYNSFLEELNKVVSLKEGSPSADSFISQYRSDVQTDKSDTEVLNTLKDNASKMLNMVKSIKDESNKLDRMFGNSIDSDTKEALIWGKLSMQEWEKEMPKAEEEIKAYGEKLEKTSGLDNSIRQTIARYGSVSNIKKRKESIEKEIEQAQKIISDKNSPLSKEEKRVIESLIESKKDILNSLNNVIDNVEEGKDVLTKKDILELDAKSRESMLEEANKSRYSKKQRKEIEALKKTLLAKDQEALKKIQKAGRRQRAYDRYLNEYTSILADPKNFNTYIMNIKQRNADRNLKLQYEDLKKMTNYNDFVRAVERVRLNSDRRSARILHETLKGNELYERMQREEKVVEGIMNQLLNTDKFKGISDNDAYLISAFTTYLSRKGINIENYSDVVQALTETEEDGTLKVVSYINDLNERLPEGVKVSMNNIGELLTSYKKALEGFKLNEKQVKEANRPVEDKKVTSNSSREEQKEAPKGSLLDRLKRNQKHNAEHREDEDEASAKISKEAKNNNSKEVIDASNIFIEEIKKDVIYDNEAKNAAIEEINNILLNEVDSPSTLASIIYQRGRELSASDEDPMEIGMLLQRISTIKLPEAGVNNNGLENLDNSLRLIQMPTTISIGRFIENSGGNQLIREGKLGRGTARTPIYFTIIDNADIFDNNELSKEMSNYNEATDIPVFAIVENEGGPITIGNKHYTPVGVLPSSRKSEYASQIRELALKNKGKLASKGNTLLTSLATIHSPKQERSEESKTKDRNFIDLLIETLPDEERKVIESKESSKMIKDNLWKKAMNRLLNHFRVGKKKGEDTTPLYFVEYKLKGRPDNDNWESSDNYYKFRIFTNYPSEIFVTDSKGNKIPFIDMLLNGSAEEIISANNRLAGLSEKLGNYSIKSEDREGWSVEDPNSPIKGSEAMATRIHNAIRDYVEYPGTITLRPKISGGEYIYDAAGNYIVDLYLDDQRLGQISGTLAEEDKAEIIKNLFLKDGKFRDSTLFQVDKTIAPGGEKYNEAQFRRVYSELVEDGIIRAGIEYLYRRIEGIKLDVPQAIKQKAPKIDKPLNPDNAGSDPNKGLVMGNNGKPINPDTGADEDGNFEENEVTSAMEEAAKIVAKMQSDSSQYELSEDEKYYVNKNNPNDRHARVTSVKEAVEGGDKFEPYVLDQDGNPKLDSEGNPIPNPWILPSTFIGNQIDTLVRDFFDNGLEGYGLESDEWLNLEESKIKELWERYSNLLSPNMIQLLYKDLMKVRANGLKGLTVISKDIKAKGTLKVKGKDGKEYNLPVMGTLDLLAYDSSGNFYIIDTKSRRSDITDKEKEKWARQLSLYKNFLEKEYGISVKGIKILPISTGKYTPPSNSSKYTISENGELLVNGKTEKVYLSPRVVNTKLIDLNPVDVDVILDNLSEEEKALLTVDSPNNIDKIEDNTDDNRDEDTTGRRKLKIKREEKAPIKLPKNPMELGFDDLTEDQRNSYADMMGMSLEDAREAWNELDEEGKENTLDCLG